jgi:hypothetical protein
MSLPRLVVLQINAVPDQANLAARPFADDLHIMQVHTNRLVQPYFTSQNCPATIVEQALFANPSSYMAVSTAAIHRQGLLTTDSYTTFPALNIPAASEAHRGF